MLILALIIKPTPRPSAKSWAFYLFNEPRQAQMLIRCLALFGPLLLSLSFVITAAPAPFASRPTAVPSIRSAPHLLERSLSVGTGLVSWDFGSEDDSRGVLGYY